MPDIELSSHNSSRRTFLTALAAAGVGLTAISTFAGNGLTPTGTANPSVGPGGVPSDGATQFAAIPGKSIDLKVLNFALTLEILEADLYRQALNLASGKPLAAPLNANSAVYTRTVGTGGLTNQSTDIGYLYLKQFAYVEAAHRDFLHATILSLGDTPVARNPNGYKFAGPVNPNIAAILGNILPLEETGVRAYLGALPYLDNLGYAQAAGGIFSTEARHSAAISYILGIDPGPAKRSGDISVSAAQPAQNTFEFYLKPKTVLQAASVYFA